MTLQNRIAAIAAATVWMASGASHAATETSGADLMHAGRGAAAATAAAVVVAANAGTRSEQPASPEAARGSDLALLFGGLGAIGFVTWRRARGEG